MCPYNFVCRVAKKHLDFYVLNLNTNVEITSLDNNKYAGN